MNQDLERIYGFCNDPNSGRWFANKDTKDSFVRYFDDFREVIHYREFNDDSGFVISVGGPDKCFQVGNDFYPTVRQAKLAADNRNEEELHYLDLIVNNMRKSVISDNNINIRENEVDYGF